MRHHRFAPSSECRRQASDLSRAVVPLLMIAALGCGPDGEAPTAPESSPSLEIGPSAALTFTQLTAGGRHTCGVAADHRAYCWGANIYGQLGDGSTTGRLRPVVVAGDLKFRELSAGWGSTCGVTTSHLAYCWGEGSSGNLGNGSTLDQHLPTLVGNGRLFRTVSVGEAHACGVSYPDNLAYCWGFNDRGVLGAGIIPRQSSPVAVLGGRQWLQVSAGWTHTCGITTGRVPYCWGSDSAGQVGDSASHAGVFTPTRVASARQFRQIDAGYAFTCAVTTADKAFCWGGGRNGEIGDGKDFIRNLPRAVAGGLAFDRVTSGNTHACAETTDNRAYCWGRNSGGSLGTGTSIVRSLTPVAVTGGRFFSQVTAGQFHSCGITSAGVAFCWGTNENGQLGDGTTTNRSVPTRVAGSI
jgi:alpha-tubulin suppressor-like RCC1 family protein